MLYVNAVHLTEGGSGHEHIESVRWRNPDTAATGQTTVQDMVTFIETNGVGSAKVEGPPAVNIGVRSTTSGRKYIQTFADDSWTNNLLSLPRY